MMVLLLSVKFSHLVCEMSAEPKMAYHFTFILWWVFTDNDVGNISLIFLKISIMC